MSLSNVKTNKQKTELQSMENKKWIFLLCQLSYDGKLMRWRMNTIFSFSNISYSYNQSYSFSSSHVWVWELEHKEGWVPKNWCFQTVVLKKTLENSLDCKEIKPVNPKGNQPWIFTGRTIAEAPILWSPDTEGQLTGKDLDAEKDWGQEKKVMTEDGMVG